MPTTPAATMNKTNTALAIPHAVNHRSCTRPGPVTSGVDSTVRPTRSSTGLNASSITPRNQSLMAWRSRPPMSKKPGWSPVGPFGPPGEPEGSVVVDDPGEGSAAGAVVGGAVGGVGGVGGGGVVVGTAAFVPGA